MSATPEQIADWLMIVAVGDAANEYTNRAKHMRAAAALIRAQAERVRVLEGALGTLGKACANYRAMHDRLGGDHIDTGRAWDEMRRAENQALAVFADRAALRGEA